MLALTICLHGFVHGAQAQEMAVDITGACATALADVPQCSWDSLPFADTCRCAIVIVPAPYALPGLTQVHGVYRLDASHLLVSATTQVVQAWRDVLLGIEYRWRPGSQLMLAVWPTIRWRQATGFGSEITLDMDAMAGVSLGGAWRLGIALRTMLSDVATMKLAVGNADTALQWSAGVALREGAALAMEVHAARTITPFLRMHMGIATWPTRLSAASRWSLGGTGIIIADMAYTRLLGIHTRLGWEGTP